MHNAQNKTGGFGRYDDFRFCLVPGGNLWYTAPMKVIRNLEISAGEFFGVVLEELAAEIKSLSGTDCTPSDFQQGYTYVYMPNDPALKVVFKIVEYQEEKLYKAVRSSAEGDLTITYNVTANDKDITVTFDYENTTPAGQQKKGIFGFFSQTIFLSRMTDKLYGIQRTVVNRKEGFTEYKSNNPLFPSIRKSI